MKASLALTASIDRRPLPAINSIYGTRPVAAVTTRAADAPDRVRGGGPDSVEMFDSRPVPRTAAWLEDVDSNRFSVRSTNLALNVAATAGKPTAPHATTRSRSTDSEAPLPSRPAERRLLYPSPYEKRYRP